ncbi:unnamed protein product [Cyprideis torosa]|uniref:Uncharacterized protein n=1 Tax=Cyprideis torosa TaxID=163714 RepID=A0A7R8WVP1_9CRUS|nr:unnamed protein product [Cyprideis torosa]CAG0907400.1 unnamed protein product [Cyprideis torosa]
MNFSDSEIVASILAECDYSTTRNMEIADLILINTCSIREKAEDTVRKRLRIFNKLKEKRPGILIGVLGCMAERLKSKFLEQEKIVDIVLGPDAYRDLPKLVAEATEGNRAINVQLSREETYADISPLRLGGDGVTAFISIMRGCDNMCSFCVVPFTRGRERSRDCFSIVAEAQDLYNKGYREVTLLGQNVDSYKWQNPETGHTVSFAELLVMVAQVHPDLRVRFSTSHPKDITDEVLYAIRDYDNICKYIHLPVQSGNSRVLELMNRTYDREWYINKVNRIYEIVPDCAISSDMIAGFCTETYDEHLDTLSIMKIANYSMSYMFYYSERPNTKAARKYEDDVPLEDKKKRLSVKQRYGIIGKSEKLDMALNTALRVASTDLSVLIQGESGVGKESMSKIIHDYSPRKHNTFIAINTGALPPGTINSELFGHEKGAFTGALQSNPGKFEQAHGGTLLLDEISEMDIGLQAKLLRVLQEREVERLGGRKTIPLDVRVLATTNRNLQDEVREGRFREDLFYRLNVFPMRLQPLRNRTDDIIPLAEQLIAKYNTETHPLRLSSDAVNSLKEYQWPGNIRELGNVIQRALILCNGSEIHAEDLHFETDYLDQVSLEEDSRKNLTTNLKSHEYDLILKALNEGNGSRKYAAEKLGISPRTLRYKLARMRDMGMQIPVSG